MTTQSAGVKFRAALRAAEYVAHRGDDDRTLPRASRLFEQRQQLEAHLAPPERK